MRSILRLIVGGCKALVDSDYRWRVLAISGKYDSMPDEEYLRKKWETKFGCPLDLDNPKTFNEKLNWLKLNNRKPEYTVMVDKYLVKKYVEDKIGKEYVISLLGVYNTPEEINFDKLPDKFVLKCNHNSGGLCICTDKSKLNFKSVKAGLEKSLKENYYYKSREWPYKNVERKIIAEQYMVDESGYELKDYKIYNFNGEPKIIQVDFDRFRGHKRNLYDTNWNLIEGEIIYPSIPSHQIIKPAKLDKMLDLARVLSKDIPFVRSDFYVINDRIYFGELTFYPEAGYGEIRPRELGEKMGDWLILPR